MRKTRPVRNGNSARGNCAVLPNRQATVRDVTTTESETSELEKNVPVPFALCVRCNSAHREVQYTFHWHMVIWQPRHITAVKARALV